MLRVCVLVQAVILIGLADVVCDQDGDDQRVHREDTRHDNWDERLFDEALA